MLWTHSNPETVTLTYCASFSLTYTEISFSSSINLLAAAYWLFDWLFVLKPTPDLSLTCSYSSGLFKRHLC